MSIFFFFGSRCYVSGTGLRLMTSGEHVLFFFRGRSYVSGTGCTLLMFPFVQLPRSFKPRRRRRGRHRYMALLPPAARLRFPFDLYKKGGATHALLDQTMICGQSIAAMTRDVGQVFFFFLILDEASTDARTPNCTDFFAECMAGFFMYFFYVPAFV